MGGKPEEQVNVSEEKPGEMCVQFKEWITKTNLFISSLPKRKQDEWEKITARSVNTESKQPTSHLRKTGSWKKKKWSCRAYIGMCVCVCLCYGVYAINIGHKSHTYSSSGSTFSCVRSMFIRLSIGERRGRRSRSEHLLQHARMQPALMCPQTTTSVYPRMWYRSRNTNKQPIASQTAEEKTRNMMFDGSVERPKIRVLVHHEMCDQNWRQHKWHIFLSFLYLSAHVFLGCARMGIMAGSTMHT